MMNCQVYKCIFVMVLLAISEDIEDIDSVISRTQSTHVDCRKREIEQTTGRRQIIVTNI